MFDNIAPKYDLLNHTLSMSIDRVWAPPRGRRGAPQQSPAASWTWRPERATWAIAMARRIRDVQVLGVDLSEQMLAVARRKIEARGLDGRIVLDRGEPSVSPWPTRRLDVATVAFGVRNFGDLGPGCANWPAQ